MIFIKPYLLIKIWSTQRNLHFLIISSLYKAPASLYYSWLNPYLPRNLKTKTWSSKSMWYRPVWKCIWVPILGPVVWRSFLSCLIKWILRNLSSYPKQFLFNSEQGSWTNVSLLLSLRQIRWKRWRKAV